MTIPVQASDPATNRAESSLRDQVRSAVIWRSGSQIVGQLITWTSTFLVIRILSPADYGLYAMTSVLLVLLNLVNGYSLANAVIQKREITFGFSRKLGSAWSFDAAVEYQFPVSQTYRNPSLPLGTSSKEHYELLGAIIAVSRRW